MIGMAFELFWEFFKIGVFAVGGGPATLPYLMDLTKTHDWYTMRELTDMIAVSESTPGPLGLNMSTYAGFETLGLFGGLVSTFGLVLPSLIIIILIAKFLENFDQNKVVKGAFYGIRPAVTAAIAAAVLQVCRVSLLVWHDDGTFEPGWKTIVLCVIILGLLQVEKCKKIHPVFWFLGAMVVGVVFRF